ncbi:2-keto-3-deoxygluconate kinase [Massilia sp. Root418]|uniref:sugar kinase n=1 Tax=Massilia sp. Root418 TaxID=1736532 RepID=UPI0006FCC0E1|nr:sugar kinase [Massilia sp. Root418]KQW93608.1 2-keto-3-deoxygluconate kinase [Massilia sp. Root418]
MMGRIVCFGEVLLRLSAPAGEMLLQSPGLDVCVGGAEANVAVSLAQFGHRAAMVSALPDNALGHAARNVLRGHGVDTGGIAFGPGRMGLYFLTPGAVTRPSDIIYDRAGSVFAEARPGLHDWAALLDGADWLHVSGVTPAIGPDAAEAVLAAVRAASALGVRVAFDGNYRASMWAAQGQDGAAVLHELMRHADLAFADQRDIALVLARPDLAREPAPGQDLRAGAAAAAFAAFPKLGALAATVRTQHSATRHTLAATLHTRAAAFAAPAVELDGIVDRIGTGDAFAAGVLHGLHSGWAHADTLQFGLAAAGLKHGIAGDFNLASAAQVQAAMTGVLDVRR